jgi:hypothetical protein
MGTPSYFATFDVIVSERVTVEVKPHESMFGPEVVERAKQAAYDVSEWGTVEDVRFVDVRAAKS